MTAYERDREVFEAARFAGDGYDRAEMVARIGWQSMASWGVNGWDLGDWPYVMVYRRTRTDDDGVTWYGLAVNVEGDTDLTEYRTEDDWRAKVQEVAEFYWRHNGNGPTAEDRAEGLHLGPCDPSRWKVTT